MAGAAPSDWSPAKDAARALESWVTEVALVVLAVEAAGRVGVDVVEVDLAAVVLVEVGVVLVAAEVAERPGLGVVVAAVVAPGSSAVRVVACAEAVPVSTVRSVDTTITVPPRRRPLLARAPVTAAGTDGDDTGTLTNDLTGSTKARLAFQDASQR
jgi:hypothetical protein